MGMKIKNSETERLVHELAKATVESMTAAITEAVRDKLARIHRKGLADRLMEISRDCAARIAASPTPMMEIGDLYDDDTGLPK
jgi:antitoxin VapB